MCEVQDHYCQRGQGNEDASDSREIEGVVEGWFQHTIREVDLKGRVILDNDGVGEDGKTHQDAREEHEEGSIVYADHEEGNGDEIGGKSTPACGDCDCVGEGGVVGEKTLSRKQATAN